MLIVAGGFVSVFVGCSGGTDERSGVMQQCAEATAAKQSPLPELRAAVTTIERRGGLPSQLQRPPLPAGRNAAAQLAKVFNGPLRTALSKPLKNLTSGERFAFDHEQLLEINRLFDRHAARLEGVRAAGGFAEAQFPIGPQLGYFANPAYLEDAAIACRFELIAAGVALQQPPIDGATAALARAARWIGWLADEPRLEPRLLAAQLRGEWLRAVEALAAHPSAGLEDYGRLRVVLVGWLADWPNPRSALEGDRAAGLHAYEAIRHGLIKEVVTGSEWARLERHGITPDTPPTGEALDRDLAVYLAAMHHATTLLDAPFHERFEQHKNVAALLDATPETAAPRNAPLVRSLAATAPLATEMFLPGVPSALEAFAIDRAACEAWALALSAAGGFTLPDHRTNPHNGELYRVEREPNALIVKTGEPTLRDPYALRRTQ